MSHTKNQEYLEQKNDVFMGALDTEDFTLAQSVINDLLDNGFAEEAFDLADRLQKSDLYNRYEIKPEVI